MDLNENQISEITSIVKDDEIIIKLIDYFKTKITDVGINIPDPNKEPIIEEPKDTRTEEQKLIEEYQSFEDCEITKVLHNKSKNKLINYLEYRTIGKKEILRQYWRYDENLRYTGTKIELI